MISKKYTKHSFRPLLSLLLSALGGEPSASSLSIQGTMALTLHRLTLLWIFWGGHCCCCCWKPFNKCLGNAVLKWLRKFSTFDPCSMTFHILNQKSGGTATPISCVLRGSTGRALSAPGVPAGWWWVEDTEQPRSVNLDHAPTPPASSTQQQQQQHLYSLRQGSNRFLPLKAAA